ncbi:MAG: SGNH/GDSL hydrolase family protein [Pseudomonadota bacterium]
MNKAYATWRHDRLNLGESSAVIGITRNIGQGVSRLFLWVYVATSLCGVDNAHASRLTPLQILALGDSYTIGEGIRREDNWPSQLIAALHHRGISVQPPTIVARTGWTTTALLQALKQTELEASYDIVTLQIGVNNQFRAMLREFQDDAFARDFHELLEICLAFVENDASRVLVVSIPNYRNTVAGRYFDGSRIDREIGEYNQIARETTARIGAQWLDVTRLSLEVGSNPNMTSTDKLHPSAAMYKKWVQSVLLEAVYRRTHRLRNKTFWSRPE